MTLIHGYYLHTQLVKKFKFELSDHGPSDPETRVLKIGDATVFCSEAQLIQLHDAIEEYMDTHQTVKHAGETDSHTPTVENAMEDDEVPF